MSIWVFRGLAALLPLVYALKELAGAGPRPHVAAAAAAGVVFAVAFVRRQRRVDNPLLDLELFRSRSFSAALGILLVGMAIVGGFYLFFTQYLQLVAGLDPLRAGLWAVPAAAGEMIVAVLAPLLARRFRPAYVVGTGLLISAIGLGVLTQVDAVAGLPVLVAGAVIVFVGTSP
jgi:DHA2 family multidrug resistance protein-like MFS transporter